MAAGFEPWAAARPHPALRHLVRDYVGYVGPAGPPLHRGLPSSCATLVVSIAEPIRIVEGPGASGGAVAWQGVVGGLHLRPVMIRPGAHDHGVQLALHPLGLRALLGVCAAELADTAANLRDLPVAWAGSLPERIAEAASWPEVFRTLDDVLTSATSPVTLVPEIRQAWRTMLASRGTRPVADVAEAVGWSRRHLAARFTAETGIGPKQAARLVRFEHSRAALRSGDYRSLADLAFRCGYYDQAHMANEWRDLAGCAPGTWLREEFPYLQDAPPPPE
jgi:AraC-like DNA-binding protein